MNSRASSSRAPVPGYLGNERFVTGLGKTKLTTGDIGGNLVTCYETLVRERFFKNDELPLVRAWIADLNGAAH
jgi:hypothetical protein